jgi:hypothetical protein
MPAKQQRPVVKEELPLQQLQQRQRQRIEEVPQNDAGAGAALLSCVQGVGALQAAQHLIEVEMRAKDAEITRLQSEVARLNAENARLRGQSASFGHAGLEELHERLAGMEQRITSAIQLRLLDDAALLHGERSCASVQEAAAACPIPPPPFAAAPPAPVPVAAAIVAATVHSISSSVLLRCVADSNRVQHFISLLSARLIRRSCRLLYAWSRRKSSGSAAAFHEHCDGQARAAFCFRRSSNDMRVLCVADA